MTRENIYRNQRSKMSRQPSNNSILQRRAVDYTPETKGKFGSKFSKEGCKVSNFYNFLNTPLLGELESVNQKKENSISVYQSIQMSNAYPANIIQLYSKKGIYVDSESDSDEEKEESEKEVSESESEDEEKILEQRYPTRYTYENTKLENELPLSRQGPHSAGHSLKKEHHRKILKRGNTRDLVSYAKSVSKSEEIEDLANKLLDPNKTTRYINDYKAKEEKVADQIKDVEEELGKEGGVNPAKKRRLLKATSEVQEMHPLATYGKTAGSKALGPKGEYEGVIKDAADEPDDQIAARIIEQNLDRGAANWYRRMKTWEDYKTWLQKWLKQFGVRDSVIQIILERQEGENPENYADPYGKKAESKKKKDKKKRKNPFG
jgi:hypothetical protein